MKKPYSLDYTIERDTDRVVAVENILDTLNTRPSSNDLELMANYILYGKNEEGISSVQAGTTTAFSRFDSFKRKEDTNISLEAILENPLAQEEQFSPVQRSCYVQKKTTIHRPKYDKNGNLVTIGDGDIPGMQELWERIDKLEHWVGVLEGKIPPNESDTLFDNSYRLYQLKHILIDMRRHQYYLKDAYKPVIKFNKLDHPKTQYMDWDSDSAYWISIDEWRRRVDTSLLHTISKRLDDYETRQTSNGLEVKWVVKHHTFDWTNVWHVRALLDNMQALRDYTREKLWTDSYALLLDFERYRALAQLSPIRSYILDCHIARLPYPHIIALLQKKFGITYIENHLSTIIAREIPQKIVDAVKRQNLLLETPKENCRVCNKCAKTLPLHTLFFGRNNRNKLGFSSTCKECEKKIRIQKGEQSQHDRRTKETPLPAMQTGKA